MKPFNLEEYRQNSSKKLITRSGEKVKRILCTNAAGHHPIVALIEGCHSSPNDRALMYTTDGKYLIDSPSDNDLFFAPEKHEGWVNIYRDFGLGVRNCKCIFDSKEEALRNSDQKAIATVKIEWEE